MQQTIEKTFMFIYLFIFFFIIVVSDGPFLLDSVVCSEPPSQFWVAFAYVVAREDPQTRTVGG